MKAILTLEVSDIHLAIEFYCQKLGLFESWGAMITHSGTKATILDYKECDNFQLHIIEVKQNELSWTSNSDWVLFQAPVHFKTFHLALEYVNSTNIKCLDHKRLNNRYQFLLTDPFGNKFMLFHNP